MKYEDWKTMNLDQLYEFGSGLSKPRSEFGYGEDFLTFKDVFNNKFIPEKLTSLVNSNEKEQKKCSIKRGDVFLTRTSEKLEELGMSSVALKDYKKATFNGFTKRLRPKEGTFDLLIPEYTAFYFRSSKFRNQITSMASMTTRASLNNSMLKRLTIDIPPIETQEKVIYILNSLYKKERINGEIILNLEELAQTLFKYWFVDFEFPNEEGKPYKSSGGKMVESDLGMIPEGWEVDQFSRLYSVKSGYAFKSAWWTESGVPVIKIKDIDDNTINKNDLSFVSSENSKLAHKFKVNSGDILIALTGATAGKFALTPKLDIDLLVNQRVGKFYYNDNNLSVNNSAYLFGLLLQQQFIDKIIDLGSGSAQSNISPTNIAKMKVILPNKKYFNMFNRKFSEIIKYITELHYENEKLITIRNTLLPKLLSGEIELPDDMEVTDDVPIS